MKLSTNTLIFILSIIAGLALGYIGGPAIILLPWAIVSIVIGVCSIGMKAAFLNGAVFGFFAAFTFMVAGYSGEAPVIARVLPFAILGLVGAVCGLVFSVIGNTIYRRVRHEK